MISFSDAAHKGSLYTLFLHSPLSAFCFVTNIVDIPIHMWDKVSYYHYLFFHKKYKTFMKKWISTSRKKNYFLPQCLAYIDRFLTEASRLLTRSRGIGKWWFYYCETIVMFDPNQIPSIIPDNITINVKLKIYIIIYQLLWLTFDYLLSI